MRVGIIQSNYIPWRGYFDFINSVDCFVLYDDIQYTRRDWRNRNLIKTALGTAWLTVPVEKVDVHTRILDVKISSSHDWKREHLNKIEYSYRKSEFFCEYFSKFESILNDNITNLSELNARIIFWIMRELEIETPIMHSKDLSPIGSKSVRLLDILKKIGATTYLSGPSAASYIDTNLFAEANIGLEYKTYDYDTYPQFYPPFLGNVSALDLLFHMGKESKKYIYSRTPNVEAIS